MFCEITAIDTLERDIKDLAELLDSFDTLPDIQRAQINTKLKTVAKTLSLIDEAAKIRAVRYNIANEERSEFKNELQEIKEIHDCWSSLVNVPHLENDLYTALKTARDSGSETAFMHISTLEQVHNIVEKLSC